MIPDEIRQQAIESLEEAMHLCDPDKGQSVCQRCLDRAATGLDAVLPLIARGLDRAYHEEWCSAAGPGCDCRFRIERDQLRQANANNLEGWAQDRAGLERRYLHAEQERDHWKQEAESRRERKVLCETLEAENADLRALLNDARKVLLNPNHLIPTADSAARGAMAQRIADKLGGDLDERGRLQTEIRRCHLHGGDIHDDSDPDTCYCGIYIGADKLGGDR